MKYKFLLSTILVILFVGLYIPATSAQQSPLPSFTVNPTCKFVLANDKWASSREYDVDIYLQSTDVNSIELATYSIGLTYNTAILNGNTALASVVGNLASTGQQPHNPLVDIPGVVKIPGPVPPGYANSILNANGGAIIPITAPGLKICTLKLLVASGQSLDETKSVNMSWIIGGSVYPTTLNAYLYDQSNTGVDDVSGNFYYRGINTNVTPFTSFTYFNITLPVELSSFGSNVNGRQINLNWETKTELNTRQFEVERSSISTNGVHSSWSTIGSLQAAGNSVSPKQYNFAEKNLQAGKYQYRLKMIDNDGTFKYSSVQSAEVAMPKEFAVSQNYPNPFNPTTTIAYQVPVDAKVIMEVYNIAGQKVSELVNQDMSAGYYTANFGASNLSSGVYIYRVVAIDKASGNNFSSIKKMMLLK
jgi:hypothetical protein